MAATIRFTKAKELARGLNLFAQNGGAVSTAIADVYYVSSRTLSLLGKNKIQFVRVDPAKYGILPVTEKMFRDLRESTKQSHQGDVVTVTDPKSLDDIIEQGRRKGSGGVL